MKTKMQNDEQSIYEQSNNRTVVRSSFECSNVRLFVLLLFTVYYMEAILISGKTITRKGNVSLMR